jgi:Zn-dependent protease
MLGLLYFYVPEGRANFVESNFFMHYINHYFIGGFALFPPVAELAKNFSPATTAALALCFLGAKLNLVLALFNLLPIPMLDGWNVYSHFFPKLKNMTSELAKGIMMFSVLILISSAHYLFSFAEFLILQGIQMIFG